jgi:hypothetical protein
LHSTGAEERAPAAGRGPTSPPDAAALLPEAMQESSDQLPLATAPQASIQRGTVSGESEAEEPTGIEPEALSSAEGGPVVQRQPDRAAPPRSAATQRAERLPLAQREPAERGLSAQALPARGGREAGVATERAPTPADGGLGTGRELEAPGRDQPRTTRVDMGALVAPAREPPVSRTVQRTVEPPTSPARAEPAPETLGKGEPEGLPGGGAGPENTAAPLQRQAVGQQRPASETLPPGVADMGGARPTPWREQPSRRPAGTEPGAGSERESSPPAVRFVLPRPVVQTKSLADTAVLPQVRRAPAPGARVAQELPPPLVQRAPLPVGGEAAAGSGAVPAPVVPVTTLQPPPQLSGQAIVQRQPSAAPIISQPDVEETAAVQRAEEGEPLPQQQTGGEKQDLDRLAREVYPLVKRLLAIERERRTGRWG